MLHGQSHSCAFWWSLLASVCLPTLSDMDKQVGSRVGLKLNLNCVRKAQDSIRALPTLWEHSRERYFLGVGKAAPSDICQAHFSWQPPLGTQGDRNY